jgi:hypothetical protein
MPDLDLIRERIADLDGQQAVLALRLVVEHERLPVPTDDWDSAKDHLRDAITASGFDAYMPLPGAPSSDGDLARVALQYYAASGHSSAEVIDQAITYVIGPAERFDVATLALGALVLAILQTELELKRDTRGHWYFRLHKKAASDSVLGQFITTFIGHFTNTGK